MVHTYEFACIYKKPFLHIIKNYEKRFESGYYENHIADAKLIYTENDDNITYTQRILTIKKPEYIPEQLLNLLGNTNILFCHNTTFNKNKNTFIIEAKNISHESTINIIEKAIFYQFDEQSTIYKLNSTITVNILTGVNNIIKNIWISNYKKYYENPNFNYILESEL